MLLRRRASLNSASRQLQRACNEFILFHTASSNSTFRYLRGDSQDRPFLASMETSLAASTSSANSKWKRGRPVTYRCSDARLVSQSSSSRPSPKHSEPIDASSLRGGYQHRDTVRTSQSRMAVHENGEAPLSNAMHSLCLGGSVQASRSSQSLCRHVHDHTSAIHSSSPPTPPHCVRHAMTQSTDSIYVPSQEQADEPSSADDSQAVEENTEQEDEEAEEHIPLTYQIPDKLLRDAMSASPNTRASFWSTKLYRGENGEQLSTHYCRSFEVSERVAQYFKDEKVLGFDIEWKPFSSPKSIKQNASLVQLACEDRVALFHIAQFEGTTVEELMPPTLRTILESPDIYKVGVAVKGDFNRLQKYLNIQPQGIFELSRLHNLVEWYATDPKKVSNKLKGLASQVLQHLQLPLYKGGQLDDDPADTANVRESDWSKPLDMQQIHYAAADAYAGFRLYHILEWKRKQLQPAPPSPQVCDFDAKPVPRVKALKASDPTKSGTDLVDSMKPEGVLGQEQEDLSDDEENAGYHTAPEDSMDSHQTEDESFEPPLKPKRVGTVSLPFSAGPDPGYPALPVRLGEDETEDISQDLIPRGAGQAAADVRLPQVDEEPDADEYADPELEGALEDMYVDNDGSLKPVPPPAISSPTSVEKQTQIDASDPSTSPTPSPPPPSQPTIAPLLVHSYEYDLATAWAQGYLKSTIPSPASKAPSRIRATVPHLRAYYLWHEQHLAVDDIAKHLRDPPLSHSTVTGYILQAISLEKLEYDTEELRAVVIKMPTALRKGRWKWMAEKVGATG